MATERDLELLDDYLALRLQGDEKNAFEKKLQADPDLNTEFQFQQRLIKGITNVRKAELKMLLQNTPVPPVNYGTSALGKFAIGTMVAGLVATGIYLYNENTSPASAETETIAATDTASNNPATAVPSEDSTSESEIAAIVEDTSAEKDSRNDVPGEKTAPKSNPVKKNTSKSQTTAEQPVIDVYEPTEEEMENEDGIDTEEPAGERNAPVKAAAPAIAVEVERDHNKYNFHYQFKDGKLLLYGPFERNLYEIMEFFSEDKRTVFLYYKEAYYLLEEQNEKVKALKLIQDPKLIEKLKDYRQN